MHAELAIGGSRLFASDGQGDASVAASGFASALEADDDAQAETLFAALAQGGQVSVPLMTTPFASRFGMANDRFGTPWMITVPQAGTGGAR
jgi:PhnB protein